MDDLVRVREERGAAGVGVEERIGVGGDREHGKGPGEPGGGQH